MHSMGACCWSQLPIDILELIGDRLRNAGDRVRFRSVCRTWRDQLPLPQTIWFMFYQESYQNEDEEDDHTTPKSQTLCCSLDTFFAKKQKKKKIKKQTIIRSLGFLTLGLSDNQRQVDVVRQFEIPISKPFYKYCLGSTGTWLVVADGTGSYCLLNPFSRHSIDLPSPHGKRIWKAIVSSCPVSPGNCIVMAIGNPFLGLQITKPGDPSWTLIQSPLNNIDDIIFYKNSFYGITNGGQAFVCNIEDVAHPTKAIQLAKTFGPYSSRFPGLNHTTAARTRHYLVEWMGQLMVVISIPGFFCTSGFEVYLFDFTSRKWIELKNLGDHSLLLGCSKSVLATPYSGLKRSCIYFTEQSDDYYSWDLRVFDMEDKSIRSHHKCLSSTLNPQLLPFWFTQKTS